MFWIVCKFYKNFIVIVITIIWDKVLLYSSEAHFVDQAGPALRFTSLSIPGAGIAGMCHLTWADFVFLIWWVNSFSVTLVIIEADRRAFLACMYMSLSDRRLYNWVHFVVCSSILQAVLLGQSTSLPLVRCSGITVIEKNMCEMMELFVVKS